MESRATSENLQTAATTGNGAEAKLDGQSKYHTFYVTGSAGVTAGAVTLETAPSAGYAGTWAPLASAITVTASVTKITQVTGALAVVRARISTTVADGTVTVKLVAN